MTLMTLGSCAELAPELRRAERRMLTDRPFRILIIEDDPVDREIYKRLLEESSACQFEFAESGSATAGLALSKTWRPDCALLDFNLPDMDGMEALSRLKGESDRLPFAVVMLTAYGGERLAVRAMKAGATDYLPKGQIVTGTLAGVITDAIERFQLQRQIEEQRSAQEKSGQTSQTLLESIPQMVWTANADGGVEYANTRWFDYTGLGPEEAARLGWSHLVHPEDLERTWSAWKQAAESGSVFEIEHRLRKAADGTYRWHLVRAVPMRDLTGEIRNWYGTCTEIENQKQAEKAILQQRKLESIGTLAGGVAHDFNNLLVGVLGGASYAMESLPPTHPAQPMLAGVVQAGERAAELTSKMLAYAGQGNRHVELTNLELLIADTCELLRASIPKTVRLEFHSGCDLPPVETDSSQMRQVVADLVMNAVEAIGEDSSGAINIRTEVVEIDGESARQNGFRSAPINAGKYVVLEVLDTGCGMDEETQSKIFDPFFTTKFTGRGLGLAAVQGFVRSHGGGVHVDSAPGKGTRFRVLLPTAHQQENSPSIVR